MKSTVDDCWYSGRHEFCKETYPGQYEWCSKTYPRCVQCTDDSHCPSEKPYCDWDMDVKVQMIAEMTTIVMQVVNVCRMIVTIITIVAKGTVAIQIKSVNDARM